MRMEKHEPEGTLQHSFMEEVYGLCLRLDKAYAKLASRHEETYYNLWAIDELGRAEAGLTQKELSSLMFAPKQTVSSIIGSLERRGLVKTLPSPTDKRSKVHTLTDEGRCLFDRADADQQAAEKSCIEHVGAERIADMLDAMGSIISCIEESFSEGEGKERVQQHSSPIESNGNESENEQ